LILRFRSAKFLIKAIFENHFPIRVSRVFCTTKQLGMQLIVSKPRASKDYAQAIVKQLQNKTDPENQAIIELVSTVMVYKFPELSREAIEAMFSVSELKQTRVYQEARDEGRQEGEQVGESRIVLRLLSRRIGELSPELRSASATKVVRRSKPYRHSN
jgi:predicted transposase YdaD